ncbi:phosphatidate cytidylyltransferase [Mycoplasma tullyi]|uniref:Phosphatidate cytidylyltransferase n=1 Tax=Mycoplasma tullyi TaxID=1612150 RepID=A0A7D7Y838_9MOLU|nr:phosphatidate cytidylyltransferase [Mycoplasma tullyi]QMT98615.1 phosphatidate cytidylyltransferase [Mycoplasma tullyi]
MRIGIQLKDKLPTKNDRLISTIVIVGVYLLLFIFNSLSDFFNSWSPLRPILVDNQLVDTVLNASIRTLFSGIVLLIVSTVFFLGLKEMGNLFFKENKWTRRFIVWLNSIYFFFSNLINIVLIQFSVAKPDLIMNINHDDLSNNIIFIIVVGVVLVINIILNPILLKLNQGLNKNNILHLFGLFFVFSLGFYGINYVLINKGWTTFLYLVAIIAMIDSFAYLFGKRFGKTKMIPQISPNKTWAGAIYGIITTVFLMVVVSVLYALPIIIGMVTKSTQPLDVIDPHNLLVNIYYITFYQATNNFIIFWWVFCGFAILILATTAILGDLYFSYVKRKYQIKDYSNVLSGHGGILDRFDGFCFVFIAFILYQIIISSVR